MSLFEANFCDFKLEANFNEILLIGEKCEKFGQIINN